MVVLPLVADAFSSPPNLAQTALLWVRWIFPPSPLLSRATCWLFVRSFLFYSSPGPLSQHWKDRREERLPHRRRVDRGRKTDCLGSAMSVGSSEDGGTVKW